MEGEKFLGMPAKYKPFVIAGGIGLVGYMLLSRRGPGGAMPSTVTPIGTAGPAGPWFDGTEQAAAEASSRDITGRGLMRQMRLGLTQDPSDFSPEWHAARGMQAELEHQSRLDKFRPGKKASHSSVGKKAGDLVKTLITGAAMAYAGGSPVTLGTSAEYAFLGGSKKKKQTSTYTGPWAPDRYTSFKQQASVIWDDREIDRPKRIA